MHKFQEEDEPSNVVLFKNTFLRQIKRQAPDAVFKKNFIGGGRITDFVVKHEPVISEKKKMYHGGRGGQNFGREDITKTF